MIVNGGGGAISISSVVYLEELIGEEVQVLA